MIGIDKETLLTREEFRDEVLQRDNYQCVICCRKAQDAHHIMERRLFFDGGYYLINGASLCGECHFRAEQTEISCYQIREAIGIKKIILPEHLYKDNEYDKWGNIILSNGQRLKGELFFDESVQKILKPVLYLFIDRIKYPRTYYLPWCPSMGKDDRMMFSLKGFEGEEVVVTEKMDGENTTIYSDYVHARSIEYNPHPSRHLVKKLQAQIGYDIPKGWRICGENLYAKHSIHYINLKSFFLVFSIWNEKNVCLNWDDTKEWCYLFGLEMVPELYRGPFNEEKIKSSWINSDSEGYVVRVTREFNYSEFRNVIGKFVRPNHIQTHGGWMRQKIERNYFKIAPSYSGSTPGLHP